MGSPAHPEPVTPDRETTRGEIIGVSIAVLFEAGIVGSYLWSAGARPAAHVLAGLAVLALVLWSMLVLARRAVA